MFEKQNLFPPEHCKTCSLRAQAALAASQDDHRETQRRISRLQEATKSLSIIDFTNTTDNDDIPSSDSSGIDGSRGRGKRGGVTRDEGLAPEDRKCSGGESIGHQYHLRQLHRMTPVSG